MGRAVRIGFGRELVFAVLQHSVRFGQVSVDQALFSHHPKWVELRRSHVNAVEHFKGKLMFRLHI